MTPAEPGVNWAEVAASVFVVAAFTYLAYQVIELLVSRKERRAEKRRRPPRP